MQYPGAALSALLPSTSEGFIYSDESRGRACFTFSQAILGVQEGTLGIKHGEEVGDTQHPYPTLSELVRWTADQVGKASRSAAEQAPGWPVVIPHQ